MLSQWLENFYLGILTDMSKSYVVLSMFRFLISEEQNSFQHKKSEKIGSLWGKRLVAAILRWSLSFRIVFKVRLLLLLLIKYILWFVLWYFLVLIKEKVCIFFKNSFWCFYILRSFINVHIPDFFNNRVHFNT